LKITPEGGYLSSSGPTISLTPWSYVTSQWSIGTVYIILLANVTQTDFYIAFLYLTNSSTPFLLRTFEYKGPNTNTLTFTGIQYVFARTTTTNSIPMPNIQIRPEAKANNDLSAIGPEVYINGNSGQIINGSQSLKLFPLRTQYFQGASDYNELWSLLTDDSGNYFFAILYVPNNNPNEIIIEHRLRLNDYTKLSGEAFDAKWRKGSFTGRITVRLPIPKGTVRLEGFPFRADTTGVVGTYVPEGTV